MSFEVVNISGAALAQTLDILRVSSCIFCKQKQRKKNGNTGKNAVNIILNTHISPMSYHFIFKIQNQKMLMILELSGEAEYAIKHTRKSRPVFLMKCKKFEGEVIKSAL